MYITWYTFLVRHHNGKIQVIACVMVRLPVPDEVFYQQAFKRNVVPKQAVPMPD